jgi:L-alanine-DL-glutamate epimerase-like enolase superfamily enzyme
MPTIQKTGINFEREPLLKPFGFKGGSLTELWQVAVTLEGETGARGLGLGVQSVLWSDAAIFASRAEAAGNSLMFLVTEYALREARGRSFRTPIELMDDLFPQVLEYARSISQRSGLRPTFALNALVPLDLAAWSLYGRENQAATFDELLPAPYRSTLRIHQERLGKIPLISYGTSDQEVDQLVRDGCFCLKIKIGANPDGDGDQEKMLAWDKERMTHLHRQLGHLPCAHTENGKIAYYLDGNGRYATKDLLLRFIGHLEKIGALSQVHLLEEPFPEEFQEDVSDIPLRLVADESAHTCDDAILRMEQGYGAIALKPIAKTMSMSLKIARAAQERDVPCFCADLTVNPLMVEWNRNFAARLAPLPGLKVGVMETNGEQNYRNWQAMLDYHPTPGARWIQASEGFFPLDEQFYQTAGGIFAPAPHYENLVAPR